MTLVEQQQLFAQLIAQLILEAPGLGYQVTLGEGWRSEEEARRLAGTGAGIVQSLHRDRLAQDLNAFRGGRLLTRSEDYAVLGRHWKAMHPLNRWGGDFPSRPDGNHFSSTRGGRQ